MRHVGTVSEITHRIHEVLGYALDDVESDYLPFELVESVTKEIDFFSADDITKLSWTLMICRLPVVTDD